MTTDEWTDSDDREAPVGLRVTVMDRNGETGVGVFQDDPYILKAETWKTSPGLNLWRGYKWIGAPLKEPVETTANTEKV
jgi:hypothetical protein